MIGSIVGSYRILDLLSAGGMGTVYRAEHTLLGRIAAVKVLHPDMCANKEVVNRFFNEAKATTAIKHPGIVEIFDFGYMPSGHAYLVMEFLDGMPLSQRIKQRGPLTEGEAAMILRSLCGPLAAAHAKGIVHRDLKPDNIFVIPDADSPLGERFKLLDFGIAKLTDVGMAGSATKTGAVMGTPTYMSPEQCKGTGDVDHRADLYSLGCILYQLLTGRPPFMKQGAGELIGAHLYMKPESPAIHVPSISPATETLVMRLLEKEPADRVQTARELSSHLAHIAQSGGWTPIADPGVSGQMASPTDATRASFMPTPVPPMFTPVRPLTPYFQPAAPGDEQQPTTLSSSQGQSSPAIATKRSRGPIIIGLAVGALAIAGVVAFTSFRNKGETAEHSAAPAAAPAPTATLEQPAEPPPPPVVVDPTPPAVADPTPPAVADPTPHAVADPPIKKPAVATKTIKRPATKGKKPAAAGTKAKPADSKPAKPAKPDPGLIESDL